MSPAAKPAEFSGVAVKKWRDAKELSRADLVRALWSLGVPVNEKTIQRWESGDAVPDANESAALVMALELTGLLDLYEARS